MGIVWLAALSVMVIALAAMVYGLYHSLKYAVKIAAYAFWLAFLVGLGALAYMVLT